MLQSDPIRGHLQKWKKINRNNHTVENKSKSSFEKTQRTACQHLERGVWGSPISVTERGGWQGYCLFTQSTVLCDIVNCNEKKIAKYSENFERDQITAQ